MKQVCFLAALWLSLASYAQLPKKEGSIPLNNGYTKALTLQKVMDRFANDIPGIGVAIYSEEGWWASSAGYAKLEMKTPMENSHLHYLQSVSKTFMAVAILQLYEQNKLSLDDPITKYLPNKYIRLIPKADSITVRMLLTHTSGIADYASLPGYTSQVILHPSSIVSVDQMLSFLGNEPLQFAPGSRYAYTNTNYLLLALMADSITGNHAAWITQHILKPLDMKNTYYNPHRQQMDYAGLTDSYWDILGTGRPANITPMQRANVATLMGDDGVVATTTDAIKFLRGLMEGKLLKPSTLTLMQQWVKNDHGEPVYGFGLIHFNLNGIVAMGHGGGGLGAGCLLLYIPSRKLYFFLAVNTGVVVDGPGGAKAGQLKDEMLKVLLQ
jgi:D-alanyl-D-alanine carboxypeptidase